MNIIPTLKSTMRYKYRQISTIQYIMHKMASGKTKKGLVSSFQERIKWGVRGCRGRERLKIDLEEWEVVKGKDILDKEYTEIQTIMKIKVNQQQYQTNVSRIIYFLSPVPLSLPLLINGHRTHQSFKSESLQLFGLLLWFKILMNLLKGCYIQHH